MSEVAAIEQALHAILGPGQHTDAKRLAQLLADVARGKRSPMGATLAGHVPAFLDDMARVACLWPSP